MPQHWRMRAAAGTCCSQDQSVHAGFKLQIATLHRKATNPLPAQAVIPTFTMQRSQVVKVSVAPPSCAYRQYVICAAGSTRFQPDGHRHCTVSLRLRRTATTCSCCAWTSTLIQSNACLSPACIKYSSALKCTVEMSSRISKLPRSNFKCCWPMFCTREFCCRSLHMTFGRDHMSFVERSLIFNSLFLIWPSGAGSSDISPWICLKVLVAHLLLILCRGCCGKCRKRAGPSVKPLV